MRITIVYLGKDGEQKLSPLVLNPEEVEFQRALNVLMAADRYSHTAVHEVKLTFMDESAITIKSGE